jgi:hypothetical protein
VHLFALGRAGVDFAAGETRNGKPSLASNTAQLVASVDIADAVLICHGRRLGICTPVQN